MPLPFTQRTLAQLRQSVGYLMLGRGKFRAGTATAGTGTTITLPFVAHYPDDALVGRTVYIAAGTGAGQLRVITASATGSGQATVSPAWDVAPDTTSQAELWSDNLTPAEVLAALNRAIDAAAQSYPVYTEQDNPTLDATRQVITLPASFTHFCGVRYLPNTTPAAPIYYVRQWAEWANPNYTPNYRLVGNRVYLSELIPTDALAYTVLGYRQPALLSADGDLAELPADYLVYMAASNLEAAEAGGPQLDPEQHSGRAANWFRQATGALARLQVPWQPNTELVLV